MNSLTPYTVTPALNCIAVHVFPRAVGVNPYGNPWIPANRTRG